jgi:endonuclease/exonuclease/phosphatase family metal-dependent hydrolase
MPKLRVATFNCENLFNRPKIFSRPLAEANALLAAVAKLHKELEKPVFDQAKIKELKEELAGFITINDVRHKHTTPGIGAGPGAHNWLGWIEFVKDKVKDVAVSNTAQVIADTRADVICLVEIENRPVLKKFHDEILTQIRNTDTGVVTKPYENILLIDGNDERGIDVAVMSRLPLVGMRTHVHETTTYMGKTVTQFSRDCLEVDLEVPGGKTLTFMANHLKSMGYSPPGDPKSEKRRRNQAERVAKIVKEHKPAQNMIVVAGDLNSPPDAHSIKPLSDHPDLYNVNLELPAGKRGTYTTDLDHKQLDYLFISKPLKAKLSGMHVERRGAYKPTKWASYPSVTSDRTAASDHSAVIAEFTL